MKKALIWIIALALVGCATVKHSVQMEKFEDMSRSYENSIRWGAWESAISMLKEREDAPPPKDIKTLEKVKVTSYELLSIRTFKDESRVEQTVKIKYYLANQLREKTVIDKQLWEYDPAGVWLILSGLPDFK
ncbi:MAG: hypothetical protein GY859_12090 [Desulfobacterales bacterium]|nr:hypothetical protein [Desulfobacterales bacterium]